MKRGISPVIAIVVLMLMTVSAAGMAYLTITTYQEEASGSAEGAVEQLSSVGQSQIKIESISEGKLYVRSVGEACESVIVQVGNEPAQVLGDCSETQSMSVFNINSTCQSGYQTVKITTGGQTITKKVECQEIAGTVEEPFCGDGNCDPDENCLTCSSDCGTCPYKLNLETSTGTGANNIFAANFSSPKIITSRSGSLRIWNVTNGTIHLENTAQLSYTGRLFASDIDNDGETEILMVRRTGNGDGELIIYNYSQPLLNLENITLWKDEPATDHDCDVHAADLDGDNEEEIIATMYHPPYTDNKPLLKILNYSNFKTILEHGPVNVTGPAGISDAWATDTIFTADVDNDNDIEIILGSKEYYTMDQEYNKGCLNITSWDGTNFVSENSTLFGRSVFDVYADDIDNDGEVEILTAGTDHRASQYVRHLVIWTFDGSNLNIEKDHINSTSSSYIKSFKDIRTGDINQDGVTEIVATTQYPGNDDAKIHLWTWNTTHLILETTYSLSLNDYVTSLEFYDIDEDGYEEILVGGSSNIWILNYTLTP